MRETKAHGLIPDFIARDPRAMKIWKHYQAVLESAGKWRSEYAAQFAVFVDAINRWVTYSAKMTRLSAGGDDEVGELLVNPRKGTTYRNPLCDLRAEAVGTIRAIGAAFGLNPLADARLKSGGPGSIGRLFAELNLMNGPSLEGDVGEG
jgi:phage terminase small subunit